jgi:restriction endonuclease S subunit
MLHQSGWCKMNFLLKDVAELQAGHPFRGSVPQVAGGNAFAVQMRDITADGDIAWDGLAQTQIDGRRNTQWLQAGDIIFVARGSRNFALCLHDVPKPAVCSQYFFLLRVGAPRLLPAFLAWQINRAPAQRYLASNAEGSDQLSIRRGVLESLPIVVPSIKKQKSIIALADLAVSEKQQLEALMRNRQRQLDALAHELHAAR